MTKKMLIDAAHPEEVRVAVLDQNKVEDFDFESAARKPLRGNIYLARVTRVEPSLQAAFVEYGGNRHGFLAFSEIHPDYYQIPVSDRQALQAAEAEVAELAAQLELGERGEDDEDDLEPEDLRRADTHAGVDDDAQSAAGADPESGDDDPVSEIASLHDDEEEEEEERGEEDQDDGADAGKSRKAAPEDDTEETDAGEDIAEYADDLAAADDRAADSDDDADVAASDDDDPQEQEEDSESAEDDAGSDAEAEKSGGKGARKSARSEREALFERYKDAKRKRSHLLRNYKIQEVVKRRQIMLVQVVKEERGTKGAALTTYMSLAGRYCVLMPNTARGGGISRKIPQSSDRKRLRRVVDSMDVPQGMGLIIRTAGAKRTKTEIKRDYDYLLRLWENIRSLTLKSIAPCLIYEEANLIKRAIRDLYDKDIGEVLVEGESGYREAKDFMKMLMPSHAKFVQPYKGAAPIFLKYGVEQQLDGMYQPTVRLKSGGYIVIHQTEALVAIDVNSGRATRERNIEQTALKTNIEAAYEAARQFRLRDLAGLIVLDFIDMEEPRNNRKVEKALKDALKNDRARIQVGRISGFGLLEMSRQRRRSGIVDGTTQACPTCHGAGAVRSSEMAALRILRAIEGEAVSGKVGLIAVHASLDVSVYILNHHRDWLRRIEDTNGVSVEIVPDTQRIGDDYALEKSGVPRERAEEGAVVRADQTEPVEIEEPDLPSGDDDAEERADGGRKKRRRRRKKKTAAQDADVEAAEDTPADDDADGEEAGAKADSDEDEPSKRRRRRGRRGGRRNRRKRDETQAEDSGAEAAAHTADADAEHAPDGDNASAGMDDSPEAGETAADGQDAGDIAAAENIGDESEASEAPVANGADHAPEPHSASAPDDEIEDTDEPMTDAAADAAEEAPPPAARKPKRKGWWSRGDA